MAYKTEVYKHYDDRSGFYVAITGYDPIKLPDGGIAYESTYGIILRKIDGVEYHETINDARQAAVDELYKRIGRLRDQISGLRTAMLNTEALNNGVA